MPSRARDTRAAGQQAPGPDDSPFSTGERPATRRFYEPLPLGSEAFLAPLPAPAEETSRVPRGVWVLAATLGAAVLVSAGALGLAWRMKHPAPARPAARPPVQAKASTVAATLAREPSPPPAAAAAAPAKAAAPAVQPAERKPEVVAKAVEPEVQSEQPAAAKPSASAEDSHHHHHHHGHASKPASALPPRPQRAQVIAAMQRVQPAVDACFGSAHGRLMADINVLGRTGRVTTARVNGLRGPIGSCVARAVRRARFPQFSDDSLTISYPFAH